MQAIPQEQRLQHALQQPLQRTTPQQPLQHLLHKNKVHRSLIRTPLYAGVEKGFLLFEISAVGFLFFVAGFSAPTALVALVWVLLIHPAMVWICARDPLLIVLYVRSLSGADFYFPHARRGAKMPPVRPSLPRRS